eukprot:3628336-Alexandrium_andersonii.AAC.1
MLHTQSRGGVRPPTHPTASNARRRALAASASRVPGGDGESRQAVAARGRGKARKGWGRDG